MVPDIDFREVQKNIKTLGGYSVGNKSLLCSGPTSEQKETYLKIHRLPSPCCECYQIKLGWYGELTEEFLKEISALINFEGIDCGGRIMGNSCSIFFRNKEEMLRVFHTVREKIENSEFPGTVKWERACREYRVLRPELWAGDREFALDSS